MTTDDATFVAFIVGLMIVGGACFLIVLWPRNRDDD